MEVTAGWRPPFISLTVNYKNIQKCFDALVKNVAEK
jgi:hypothetical protein